MDTLLEVLASTSFLEKVFLLVMGAALTGIIVPVVKFRMDQSRFEQQKKFEAAALYFKARRERGLRVFKPAEAVLFGVIVLGAVAGVVSLATGAIAI